MHIFEYGIPEYVGSDLGSQIVRASNIITDFLKDAETQNYFSEQNIKSPEFEQYFKGNSSLGSLVESCVKISKRVIYGSIGNNILNYVDFEYTISHINSIINKRPIAFKDALTNDDPDIPDPITPEQLLKGYVLPSVNVIPDLQSIPDESWDEDPVTQVKENFSKLRKIRENLIKIYNEEFLTTLIVQATNKSGRYKPKLHHKLKVGDLVLLKEKFLKSSEYPMGIVKEVQTNIKDEVTGAKILKGKTKELVKRHVSSLIPLLSVAETTPQIGSDSLEKVNNQELDLKADSKKKNVRKAAIASTEKTKQLYKGDLA